MTSGNAKGILSVEPYPQEYTTGNALNVSSGRLSLNQNRVVTFTDSLNKKINAPISFIQKDGNPSDSIFKFGPQPHHLLSKRDLYLNAVGYNYGDIHRLFTFRKINILDS